MNWAGFAFKCAETDFRLGADIMNITAGYLNSKMKQSQLEAQKRNYEREASYHIRLAGRIQENGRMAREQRLIQLGQDEGRIYASAAGSGIDVSSRIVKKTVTDTARAAHNDAMQMARNEVVGVEDEMNKRLTAIQNAIWTGYAAKIERHNRKMAVAGGALEAFSRWNSGMASAAGSLMGGG